MAKTSPSRRLGKVTAAAVTSKPRADKATAGPAMPWRRGKASTVTRAATQSTSRTAITSESICR